MIEDFEVAPSSQSSCKKCNKKIEKGAGRGVFYQQHFKHRSRSYLCLKCSKKILKKLLEKAGEFLVIK